MQIKRKSFSIAYYLVILEFSKGRQGHFRKDKNKWESIPSCFTANDNNFSTNYIVFNSFRKISLGTAPLIENEVFINGPVGLTY
jgi:hypothetical protein